MLQVTVSQVPSSSAVLSFTVWPATTFSPPRTRTLEVALNRTAAWSLRGARRGRLEDQVFVSGS
ncbi:hypothetical protein D7X32_44195 [Corallococcus carmarthensis]|uniref:Uncharacterized protein n=1 Tax=Corallococcus carmarthensis TaxID=2316728 RepID=A0A3A8JQR8_9BACT|nr:hypothetical protein D7X32_44195 [Corallococcus carmarthensis]